MTTLDKIKSNRRNAMRSTGPKTKMGKAISSKNALRHGLLSRAALLPDEDPEAFADLQRGIEADLDPAGEIECRLVDRVTMAIWRLARAQRVEASVFAHRMADQRAHLAASDARSCESYVLTEVLRSRTGRSRIPNVVNPALNALRPQAPNGTAKCSVVLSSPMQKAATRSQSCLDTRRLTNGVCRGPSTNSSVCRPLGRVKLSVCQRFSTSTSARTKSRSVVPVPYRRFQLAPECETNPT